jgi:hypothetical protein
LAAKGAEIAGKPGGHGPPYALLSVGKNLAIGLRFVGIQYIVCLFFLL